MEIGEIKQSVLQKLDLHDPINARFSNIEKRYLLEEYNRLKQTDFHLISDIRKDIIAQFNLDKNYNYSPYELYWYIAHYLDVEQPVVNVVFKFQCIRAHKNKSTQTTTFTEFEITENIIYQSDTNPTQEINRVNEILKVMYNSYQTTGKKINIEKLSFLKELNEIIRHILSLSGIGATYIKNYKVSITAIGTPLNIMENVILAVDSYELDGIIKNVEWCKNRNMCVPDWLMFKYGTTKGHIKSVKDEDIIQKLSTHDGETLFLHNEPNKNGYNLHNISLFCKNTKKTLIALHNGSIVIYNQVKECDFPLVIEVKNNHLYPITNTKQIQSIAHIQSTNFKYNNKYDEIDNPFNSIEYITPNGDSIDYILETMNKLHTQTYKQKLILTNGHLHNFRINGVLYSTNPYNEDVKKYCETNKILYTGQSPLTLLKPFMEKLPTSFMNNNVKNALFNENVKFRTHYGTTNNMLLENHHILDINKQYRFIMENPMDDFMTFDFNTEVKNVSTFNGYFGLWFAETEDMTILHKTNWYSNNILQMAVDNGIQFKVRFFIKGIRNDKNILKNIINEIKDIFSKEITKTMINSISGMLGKTDTNITTLQVDCDINRVWELFKLSNNLNEMIIRESDGLYIFGKKHTTQLLNNNLPMYIQILDWANMLLAKYIISLGGFKNLYFRKTDCFIMNDVGIEPQCTDTIGGYKSEIMPSYLPPMNEERAVIFKNNKYKWEGIDVKNSDDYEKVITHLANNSLMIASRAGTGKSFIINEVAKNYKCVKLAYSNKASINIGGQTIHSFFGIDVETNSCDLLWLLKRLKGVEYIVIDEISMLDGDIWKIIYQIKLMSSIKFLLCGDFRQLPPIDDNTDYFNHQTIMYICDGFRCELEFFEKCRYDKVLYDLLEDIWNEKDITINTSQMVLNGSHICYTNNKRKEINKLKNTTGELIKYKGASNSYNEDIRINEGVPLMTLLTNKKLGFVKNEIVLITKIKGDLIYFGVEKYIDKKDIHKYFMLGYALTIHKAQGDTIDGILNIHEIQKIMLEKRLIYTAISRATTKENIRYIG